MSSAAFVFIALKGGCIFILTLKMEQCYVDLTKKFFTKRGWMEFEALSNLFESLHTAVYIDCHRRVFIKFTYKFIF